MRRYASHAELTGMANGWEGLFDEFFNKSPATDCEWCPALDVREQEKQYLVRVDLPGITKADIKLTFESDVLTITGERKIESQETHGQLHRTERRGGKFTRSLRFPSDVDAAKIDASFHDGVLEVKLEKTEAAVVRQIEVK
jgi:HSP20 family protein